MKGAKKASKTEQRSSETTSLLNQGEINKCVQLFKYKPNVAVTENIVKSLQGPSQLGKINISRFDSVAHMLAIGLQNIKLLLPSSVRAMPESLQAIFSPSLTQQIYYIGQVEKAMKHKDYRIAQALQSSQSLESQLNQQSEKTFDLQNQLKNTLVEFKTYQESHAALQNELKQSVPMHEYERLKEALGSVS